MGVTVYINKFQLRALCNMTKKNISHNFFITSFTGILFQHEKLIDQQILIKSSMLVCSLLYNIHEYLKVCFRRVFSRKNAQKIIIFFNLWRISLSVIKTDIYLYLFPKLIGHFRSKMRQYQSWGKMVPGLQMVLIPILLFLGVFIGLYAHAFFIYSYSSS